MTCKVCGGPPTDEGREIGGHYFCSSDCFIRYVTERG